MKKFLIGGMLVIASFAVQADELILTPGAAKAGVEQISIDLVSSGEAVAFQFNIRLPKGIDASKVDLRSCVSELPKSHSGQCAVAKGQIIGLVSNDSNLPLAAGIIPVGVIKIAGVSKTGRRGTGFEIAKFLVSDKDAKAISSSARFVTE